MKQFPKRSEVKPEHCWDLTAIFKTPAEAAAAEAETLEAGNAFVEKYEGEVQKIDDPKELVSFIQAMQDLQVGISRVFAYHYLGYNVDMKNPELRNNVMRIRMKFQDLGSRMSFVENELALLPVELLEKAKEEGPQFATFFQDLIDWRPHRLDPATESALAHLAPTLTASSELYSTVKFNDMSFPDFEANGKTYPLSYVLYENNYSYDPDTAVRRESFKHFSETLGKYRNITAAIYNHRIQYEKQMADLRGFDSVFDYLLWDQKVDRELYDRQIDVIMDAFKGPMRRYAKLIQKVHGLDTLYFSDLKLPLDPDFSAEVTPEQAKEKVAEALSAMGDEYRDMLLPAFDERWLDFAQNDGKSTGGFAMPVRGAHPYILLNWDGGMAEVFTLIHELGHAGQFLMSQAHNEPVQDDMSMYSVEAPSTFHETLLAYSLSQDAKEKNDPRYERWIWSLFVGNTYYHNFVTHLHEAAYQREVYKLVDEGRAVTADMLDEIFKGVLEAFWGDTVVLDPGAERTWMRQPHYYSGLYSYTYSAGLTIGTEMFQRLNREGPEVLADWRKFLAAGGSLRPVEQAQLAGVDITTDAPLKRTIDYVDGLIRRMEELTEELGK